jgi:hypothetical protein
MGKKILFLLMGLVTIFFVSSCATQSILKPEVDFSSSECQGPISNYKEGVKSQNWLDDTTLQIQAYVIINCCNKIEKGNVEIRGNKIILGYFSVGEDLCNCICGHNLTYTIRNIEKKDYAVNLSGKTLVQKITTQTYRNDEYGFELEYPQEYKMKQTATETGFALDIYSGEDGCVSDNQNECWYINIIDKGYAQKSDLDYHATPFYEQFNPRSDRVITDVTIGNMNGKKAVINIEGPTDVQYTGIWQTKTVFYVEKGNLAYFIQHINKGKPEDYSSEKFSDLLSSLKIFNRDDQKFKSCVENSGTIKLMDCYCEGVADFPNICATGVCTCNPAATKFQNKVKICDCGNEKCFDGNKCVSMFSH